MQIVDTPGFGSDNDEDYMDELMDSLSDSTIDHAHTLLLMLPKSTEDSATYVWGRNNLSGVATSVIGFWTYCVCKLFLHEIQCRPELKLVGTKSSYLDRM